MVRSPDARRDVLPKQIGCMNSIFQLFDRRLFLVGRHHRNTLFAVSGGQQVQQLGPPLNATKAVIEKDPESQKSLKSPEVGDVVKDAMYREARGVAIKSFAKHGLLTVIKHIDSPRFSYDGRESVKPKEPPRFSLDSKAASMQQQRSDGISCLVPAVKTGSGSHSRSSSIVTKLMGLEDFVDESCSARTRSGPRVALLSQSPTKQVSSRKNVRKTTLGSKLPLEPAPWKKKDCQKTATQSGTSPCSSVYGEIEKRITQLEFKRSGKDLRALKHILEAMQKTRQKLENQRQESDELKLLKSTSEDSSSNQNNTNQQPVLITEDTCHSKQLSSSSRILKSTKAMGNVKISSSSQLSKPLERANSHTAMNNNKKITKRNTGLEHSAAQCIRVEKNCTTSGWRLGTVSPRMRHNVLKTEREYHHNTSTSESDRARKHLSKKVRERCPENGKHRAKSMDLQISSDRLNSLSSEKQYSCNHADAASTKSESRKSAASHVEIEAISSVNFFSLNSRKQDYVTTPKQHMPATEPAVITMEQPSPVSVLDDPFYIEGSPSPVRKISTAFREDESSSPDEAEWNLQNLNHIEACSDLSYKNNQKSENLLKSVPESRSLQTNGTAYQSINSGQRNITKMLLAFGLLNDMSIIRMDKDNHPVSLDDIFKSNMFHALVGEYAPTEDANKELTENNDHKKFSQQTQRKIVADAANEILVRKLTSGRLFTRRGRMSLQGLIKEVYLEIEHLCRMPYCNIDDKSIRVLTADMKYQSEDWSDYNDEVPALVLDIERLIFKELINEVITCEVWSP